MQPETGTAQEIRIQIHPEGLKDLTPDYAYDATVRCAPYQAVVKLSSDETLPTSIEWVVEIRWPIGERPQWADDLSLTISEFRRDSMAVDLFSMPLMPIRTKSEQDLDEWTCNGVITQGGDPDHPIDLRGHYSYQLVIKYLGKNATGEPGGRANRHVHKIDPLLVLSG